MDKRRRQTKVLHRVPARATCPWWISTKEHHTVEQEPTSRGKYGSVEVFLLSALDIPKVRMQTVRALLLVAPEGCTSPSGPSCSYLWRNGFEPGHDEYGGHAEKLGHGSTSSYGQEDVEIEINGGNRYQQHARHISSIVWRSSNLHPSFSSGRHYRANKPWRSRVRNPIQNFCQNWIW